MRKILYTLIMSFSFFGLFAQTDNQFRSVDVKEFSKIISDPDVVVLDVRTVAEYADGHIPGTDFNIDVLEDGFAAEAEKKISKDKTVALYCRSGNRSKSAARTLAGKGYEVIELGSGYRGWVSSGNKIER